jgi:hypothetical protein
LENPTLEGKGVPFLAFIPFFFGLPSFFMILEGTFGINLEVIWKFTCGLKILVSIPSIRFSTRINIEVIKISTHVAAMLSILFGAACLFTAISSTPTPTPTQYKAPPVNPDVHYFFYPLVLGGMSLSFYSLNAFRVTIRSDLHATQSHFVLPRFLQTFHFRSMG